MTPGALDAGALQKQLEYAWVEVGRQMEGDGVLRACSMTLIALHGGEELPGGFSATLGDVLQSHPARVLDVNVAAEDSLFLDARVGVQCWLAFGKRQHICSETVAIRCSISWLDELAPVLVGLLTPDLPVVLWVADQDLIEETVSSGIAPLAGKIVVDTRSSESAKAVLPGLMKLSRKPGMPVLADLAWTSLTPWRKQIAQLFASQERLQQCGSIQGLILEHGEGGQPAEAWYLVAWFANCMGWNISGAFLETGKRAVALKFMHGPIREKGRLQAVHLTGEEFRVTLRRTQDGGLEIRAGSLEKRFPQAERQVAGLLIEELSVPGADPAFQHALQAAAAAAEHYPTPVAEK